MVSVTYVYRPGLVAFHKKSNWMNPMVRFSWKGVEGTCHLFLLFLHHFVWWNFARISKKKYIILNNNVITIIQEKKFFSKKMCFFASPVHVSRTQRPPCPDCGHRLPLVERRGAVQGEGIKVELVVLVFQEGERRRGLALLLQFGLWSGEKTYCKIWVWKPIPDL